MEAYAPALRADRNQLERVQRLATRLVSGLHSVPNEERYHQLNLFSLERGRLQANLKLTLPYHPNAVLFRTAFAIMRQKLQCVC